MTTTGYIFAILGGWLVLSAVGGFSWSFAATRLKARARRFTDLAVGLPPVPLTAHDAEFLTAHGIDATGRVA